MSQRSSKPIGESAGADWQRYVSKTGDDLLNQFAAISDAAKAKDYRDQLQQTFADEAPAIPALPWPKLV